MRLNFQVLGSGSPLIILHGLLGSNSNWLSSGNSLAAQLAVYLLDLRNHGESPHADEFDNDVMAADVAEFIREQKLGRVNLLGHSLGGKVAMRFAQLYPETLNRLVVVDMSPREMPPRFVGILDAMLNLDLSEFQRRDEVDAALVAAIPEKALRQFLLKNIGRDEAGGLRWKANLAAIRANYAMVRRALPLTPTFSGPTLFVRGGKSDYIRDADFDIIRQIFPSATVQTIQDAGHWVHAEAPEDFLRVVTEFLLPDKQASVCLSPGLSQ